MRFRVVNPLVDSFHVLGSAVEANLSGGFGGTGPGECTALGPFKLAGQIKWYRALRIRA